jgi:hypothetical protein
VAGAFFVFLRAFLKGVLEKAGFGRGFWVVRLWWIGGGSWWFEYATCGGWKFSIFLKYFFFIGFIALIIAYTQYIVLRMVNYAL